MKKIIFATMTLFALSLVSINSCSNSAIADEKQYKSAADFFNIDKTQVMVVGTFHFDYPNLDALKTEDKDMVDVLSESRQKEMDELIQYIKEFKPTKIGIEAHDNSFTEDLKNYNKGKLILSRDERHQLGVRLASELNLDTIYAIDAGSFSNELSISNPDMVEEMWKDYDWRSDDIVDSLKREWFEYKSQVLKEMSLLAYHKYINSEESHHYGYGTYLTGDFMLGETRGADVLSTYWYNRNLRIFRKIQDMTEDKDDRILLIFGNGHAALLRQFLAFSPEYDFVEFDSL